MKPQNMFIGIQLILILAGAKIHHNLVIRLLVIIVRFLIFFTTIHRMQHTLSSASSDINWFLVRIVFIIEYSMVLMSTTLMIIKQKAISQLSVRLFTLLDAKLRAYFRKLSITVFCFLITLIFIKTLILFSNCLFVIQSGKGKIVCFTLRGLELYIFYPLVSLDWILIGGIPYLFFLIVLRNVEISYFKNLSNDLQKTKQINILDTHKKFHYEITELKEYFEKVLNIFPLMWFMMIFSQCSSFIAHRQADYDNRFSLEFAVKFATYCLNMILVFYVCFYNEKMNNEISKEAENVIRLSSQLIKCCDYQYVHLLDEFRKTSCKLTAWGLFELRKSLFLSFLSAMVTFTVLFMQIKEKGI